MLSFLLKAPFLHTFLYLFNDSALHLAAFSVQRPNVPYKTVDLIGKLDVAFLPQPGSALHELAHLIAATLRHGPLPRFLLSASILQFQGGLQEARPLRLAASLDVAAGALFFLDTIVYVPLGGAMRF